MARLDLNGHAFEYVAGQAVLVSTPGHEKRRPYSIAAAPEDARRDGFMELLVGVDEQGLPGPHLTLEAGHLVDVEGPLGAFTFPAAPDEQRFVFIAGGTGIAPLRAMLRQTLTRANDANWTGPRGRLKRDALEELVHHPATLCFVCGPPSLVDEMPKLLEELGISRERIKI